MSREDVDHDLREAVEDRLAERIETARRRISAASRSSPAIQQA